MAKNFNNKPSSFQQSKQNILYGRHAVLSALANPKRQINKILCTKENIDEIRKYTKIVPQIVEKKEIDKLFSLDTVHQGFALFCNRLPDYSLEEIIEIADKKEKCHILILDQVTDPQNVGAIIRSAVAFNTLALVMQDKNSPIENGAMAKAAAGMIEHLPIVRVTNLSRAIEKLKNAGFWTIGMDGYATTTIDKLQKPLKTAIIMGSEGKGMRRLVEENCDISVKLPMSPLTESLNVATAAAITLYEINK
ncbi:MAG: 23S rRNA (guanosine(2251)-2'-O)-methyltransferase RlmB [Alphaproteobacteria bacterium]|nr:23S rRNA (guanosine(2251)-2'-O)-methyltransferase RlmB [Alphaproteobacteria bacterium]